MTTDLVFVAMSAEQARAIEEIGTELLRAQDARATTLLTVSLAWKFASQQNADFSRRVEAPERTLRVLPGGAA